MTKLLLKEIAIKTNRAEFERLYHDATIHTNEIAARYGINSARVSEFAHLLGVKTRREVGVMWKPTLLRPKATPAHGIATHGCNEFCPAWQRCNDERLWLDALPCETLLDDEIGVEWDSDSSPSYWVMPLQVRVNTEAL